VPGAWQEEADEGSTPENAARSNAAPDVADPNTRAVQCGPMKAHVLGALYEGLAVAGQRVGLHERRFTNRDAIMMYHSVRDPEDVRPPTSDVTVAEFRRHLEYFLTQFEVVDLPAVLESEPDRKRIALTFDDGYRDFYTHVRPVLHEYDVPATVFVVTDFLDNANPREQVMNTGHLFDTLTSDQVRDLADDPLVTVGSHTRTHHNLGRHDRTDIIREEVYGAKAELADRFGIDADRFCYPNGGFNATSVSVVESAHTVATMDESRRPLLDDEHPLLLPRVDGGLPFDRIQWRLSDLNGELMYQTGHAGESNSAVPVDIE
jgi:peptidoglycan/xylan/chitin deacetylase (PgdA/CDA1 family)